MFSLLVLLRPTESLVDCSLEVESPTGVVLLELSDVVVVAELDDGPGSDSYLVPLGMSSYDEGTNSTHMY